VYINLEMQFVLKNSPWFPKREGEREGGKEGKESGR